MQLRPYQVDAVASLRERIGAGARRVLFVLATGGGKTVVFSHVIASALAKGTRTLVLAHRRELIDQAVSKLLASGVREQDVGVIRADDKRRRPGAPVQVASVDTLRNRVLPTQVGLVIIDEAHRALAESYTKIAAAYPDAVHLGFTATPVRGDGKGLSAAYDEIVVAVPISQLIAEGHLIAPQVFTVPAGSLPDLKGIKTTAGDYNTRQLGEACAQGQLVGDIVDHWERRADGRRTVVFAVTVEHSRQIVERFRARGHAAEHLDGETDEVERAAILRRLDSGETTIVSNVGVLTEGWDQPSCKVLVLARPTQSLGLYLQMAGRILRPWQGVPALILDHAGCVVDHGLPHVDREWELEPGKKRRKKGATEEDCAKSCPECFAVADLGTRVCACGYEWPARAVRPLTEGAGELVEATEEMATTAQHAAWAALVASWRDENVRRMERPDGKPRKPGWLWHAWRQRNSNRPPPKGARMPKLTQDEIARIEQLEHAKVKAQVAAIVHDSAPTAAMREVISW